MGLKSILESLFGNKLFIEIYESFNFQSDYIWDLIGIVFNDVILPVGYAFLGMYFLLELLEKTTRDNFNLEQFIRLLIKLLIGKILMDNCLALLQGIQSFADLLSKDITENASSANIFDYHKLYDLPWYKDIILYVKVLVPGIVMLAVSVVAKTICITRSIEIVIRAIVAPIGMADIFTEGTRGAGFRYVKKFLAVNLQGFMILIIALSMQYINKGMIINSVLEPKKIEQPVLVYKGTDYEVGSGEGGAFKLLEALTLLNIEAISWNTLGLVDLKDTMYDTKVVMVDNPNYNENEAEMYKNGKKFVVNDVNDIPTSFIVTSMLLGFATITLLMKSKEFANDICGV